MFRRKNWLIIGAFALLLFIPLFVVSDLFFVPKHISTSRTAFDVLRTRFQDKPELPMRHTQQLARFIEESHRPILADVAPETLVAYLYEQLDLDKRDVAIYPGKEAGRIILSKREDHSLPMVNIILSLEVELKEEQGHLVPQLVAVRRGGRQVATELGWAYFGRELQLLEQLGTKLNG